MTTLNQTKPLPIQNDSDKRGSHKGFNRTSDFDRILSFCQKRTTLNDLGTLDFPRDSPNECHIIRTRFSSDDHESPNLISELIILGQRAIQSTAELLDPCLKKLASEYASSSHSRRYEICAELYHSLLTQSQPVRSQKELLEHIWDDLSNQSCNRIFARQFTKHGNPNCIGRALIILAFAKLANATVLGATPLIPSSEVAIRHDCRVARRILRHARRHKVQLKPELISFLEFIVTRPELDRVRPAMFHMGVVFQIGSAGWVLIDPHAKVFGKYQNEALISQIEKNSIKRPQAIFNVDYRAETNIKICDQFRKLKSLTTFLHQIQTLSTSNECDIGEALHAIITSKFLEFILSDEWNISQEQKEKIASQLRGVYSPVVDELYLEQLLGKKCPMSTLSRIQALLEYFLLLDCGKEFVGLLSFHVSAGTQTLRQEMLKLSFAELLSELIARFHGFMFNKSSMGNDQKLLHPGVELYQPEFRVGVELISHVNAVTLCSENVTQKLSRVCNGQSVQLSTATEILRNQKGTIHLSSKRAFDKLCAAEIQSDRLQEILNRISIKYHTHIQEHEIS
ncbi:hypothetical protein [uncultured Gimesia sp.]|uniref:hypothetical protein n=1 Tax=uncultured Gimesia sp. TaxID=1678688 RepID=UPI0030DD0069|tara:strand:- start:24982 stop:26685 length:1704 start_codon:yes stop_codon:yes gene_type:complete